MKNFRSLFIPVLLAILVSALFAASSATPALAQDPVCTDATGATIPCPPPACGTAGGPACPPTEDSSGGGNQNPTSVPPTATPLPISAAPTSPPLPDENHLGQCTEADGDLADCAEQFKCEDGLLVIKVDLYSGNGTVYDFYCIPDENVPQLDLPIAVPTDTGTDDNWTGDCPGSFPGGVDACLDIMSGLCSEEGGDLSVWYDDEGGAGVHCENQSEGNQPAPTEIPAIASAPTDDGNTDGDTKDECSAVFGCIFNKISCWSAGGHGDEVVEQGTTYYKCWTPDEGKSFPPGGWLPWIAGIVMVVALLLPAVQKVRSAASHTNAHTREHILLNKDDEPHMKKAVLFVRKQGSEQQDYSPENPQDIKSAKIENAKIQHTPRGFDQKKNQKL